MSSEQQLRPRPHFYSLAFPYNSTPRSASNLQRAFDPLGSTTTSAPASAPSAEVRVQARAMLLAHLLNGPSGASAEVIEVPEHASPAQVHVSPVLRVAKPLITYQRRRLRPKAAHVKAQPAAHVMAPPAVRKAGAVPPAKAGRRCSKRLAAKASASFVDMTSIAVQRKALLNSLSTCSLSLKKHVNKRNILSRNNLPLDAAELRKLVLAAKIDCSSSGSGAGSASLMNANDE